MFKTSGFFLGIMTTLLGFAVLSDRIDWPPPSRETPARPRESIPPSPTTVPNLPASGDSAGKGEQLASTPPPISTPYHPASEPDISTHSDVLELVPIPVEQGNFPTPKHAQTVTEKLVRPTSESTRSYFFWSPFRSEIAANGFANGLSLSTALPIEVVRTESGEFRVKFDYVDEAELHSHIELITAITGLRLD